MGYSDKVRAVNSVDTVEDVLDDSQVSRELRGLGDSTATLWNKISQLEDALRPVLCLHGSEKEKTDATPHQELVPVATKIQEHRIFIDQSIARLESIFNRLGV